MYATNGRSLKPQTDSNTLQGDPECEEHCLDWVTGSSEWVLIRDSCESCWHVVLYRKWALSSCYLQCPAATRGEYTTRDATSCTAPGHHVHCRCQHVCIYLHMAVFVTATPSVATQTYHTLLWYVCVLRTHMHTCLSRFWGPSTL